MFHWPASHVGEASTSAPHHASPISRATRAKQLAHIAKRGDFNERGWEASSRSVMVLTGRGASSAQVPPKTESILAKGVSRSERQASVHHTTHSDTDKTRVLVVHPSASCAKGPPTRCGVLPCSLGARALQNTQTLPQTRQLDRIPRHDPHSRHSALGVGLMLVGTSIQMRCARKPGATSGQHRSEGDAITACPTLGHCTFATMRPPESRSY